MYLTDIQGRRRFAKMKKALMMIIFAAFAVGMIHGGTITVTQPSGGSLAMGSSCPIAWTANGVSAHVKIQLIKPGGGLVGPLASDLPPGSSPFAWTVAAPAVVGEQYRIRVHAKDGSADGESAIFTVVQGGTPQPSCTLHLISPLDGALWLRDHGNTIQWTSTNLAGQVRLELVRYLGPMLGIIAENLPASGSYGWTKTGEYSGHTAPAGKYVIRVRSMANFQCFAESDPFNLKIFINPELGPLKPLPLIEAVLPVPLGAITPGTQLFIKGKRFDYQPVEILMFGDFPDSYDSPGPVQLTKVTLESSTQVNGFVPVFSDKGQLDQTVEIRVKNGRGGLSNPWKVKFKGRKEQKVVLRNDVTVLHCGADGNCNYCNDVVHKDSDLTWTMYPIAKTISGYHYNKFGAVGYDKGYDQYQISLKNGWKFKSLQKEKWEKSSGNEVLDGPTPPFPEGDSNWTPKIRWVVSPNDYVKYLLIIIAEGPLGTHYK
jgi:hypothetical protein